MVARDMSSHPRYLLVVLMLSALVSTSLLSSCRSALANRDPVGLPFPAVVGASLEDEEVALPGAFEGRPVVLLLGYVQKAQFDGDRWLFGLLQARTPVAIREVPTIEGFVPRLIANQIDSGMRSGIPFEDWASVVTVYGADASKLVSFTGNETPRNMRVILLDGEGRVRWFHDRGFSAAKLLELDQAARESAAQSN